jgi:hypothetical protein
MAKLKEKVQSLVDAKKFDEAITLLGNVDNPHATHWIHRIEAMRTAHFRQAQWRSGWFMVAAFFACFLSCLLLTWFNGG